MMRWLFLLAALCAPSFAVAQNTYTDGNLNVNIGGKAGTTPAAPASLRTSVAGAQYGLAIPTSTALTVPATATIATVTVEGAAIRYTTDGATTPTASVGMGPFPIGTTLVFNLTTLAAVRIIQTQASATVDVEVLQVRRVLLAALLVALSFPAFAQNPVDVTAAGGGRWVTTTFIANGTYTAEADVTSVYITGCAAGPGGGGGQATPSTAGGGGGGSSQCITNFPMTVTAGQVLTIAAPTGGAGGPAGSNGSPASPTISTISGFSAPTSTLTLASGVVGSVGVASVGGAGGTGGGITGGAGGVGGANGTAGTCSGNVMCNGNGGGGGGAIAGSAAFGSVSVGAPFARANGGGTGGGGSGGVSIYGAPTTGGAVNVACAGNAAAGAGGSGGGSNAAGCNGGTARFDITRWTRY